MRLYRICIAFIINYILTLMFKNWVILRIQNHDILVIQIRPDTVSDSAPFLDSYSMPSGLRSVLGFLSVNPNTGTGATYLHSSLS